jgi:hypothetical protein
MKTSRLQPRAVLWWGILATLAGAVLVVSLPSIGFGIVSGASGGPGVDQGILVALDVVVRLLNAIVIPLGVALIGASVVMTYLRRMLRPTLGAIVAERVEAARDR